MSVRMFFSNNPFVRIALAFIVGELLCCCLGIPFSVCLLVMLASLIAAAVVCFRTISPRWQWVQGAVLMLTVASVAMCISAIKIPLASNSGLFTERNIYRAVLLNPPMPKNNYLQSKLQIEAVSDNGQWKPVDLCVMAKFTNDSAANELKAGQTIEMRAQIAEPRSHLNPFGFDFKQYLNSNGIVGSIYVDNNWQLIDSEVRGLKQIALNVRQRLVGVLAQSGLTGNELGLACTLVLGYRDNIDAEIKQAYMCAGAMHVLAVSGMHVGIIYAVLEWIMQLFGGKRFYRIKLLAIMLFLWVYAFITGLSPSVMRAAVMFSVVIIGRMAKRQSSIYNSLAASAVLLLVINPRFLFSAGFQLSYMAVIGIVTIAPVITQKFETPWGWLNKIWELVAVSIAAQIATFALCRYYFDITPVYFFISSVVVSVGAVVLMVLTLATLVASGIMSVAVPLFSELTAIAAKLLNSTIVFIANLPGATLPNRDVTIFQAITIFSFITFALIWLVAKKRFAGQVSLLCVLVLLVVYAEKTIHTDRQSSLNVYYDAKAPSIHFFSEGESWWWQTDTMPTQHITKANEYWRAHKSHIVTDTSNINGKIMSTRRSFFAFGDVTGLVLKPTTMLAPMQSSITLDYVVVCGKTKYSNLQNSNIKYRTLIVDATMPPWYVRDWSVAPAIESVYNVRANGAAMIQKNWRTQKAMAQR
ncbi:MAG: ComEC family competence protein [Salinivirgaceae bacterium]|nr:ComEC family competence protein [Salinivirgaceae bacterium]